MSGEINLIKDTTFASKLDAQNTLLSQIVSGMGAVVDSSFVANSTNPVQSQVIKAALDDKVDKEQGKGLSTNDFDNTYKGKLDNVDSTVTASSGNLVTSGAVATAISNLGNIATVKGVVAAKTDLPASGNKTGDIYFVGTDGLLDDNFEEYIWTANSKWEFVGTTQLTVDSAITQNSANPVQSGAVYTALEGKVDVVSGKGLSSNDYTTAEKTKLAGLSATPYVYMTVDEYLNITPTANTLYWVTNTDGEHGVYKNGAPVEGKDVAVHIYGALWDGTSSTSWTRTDDAASFGAANPYVAGASSYGSPFDNISPWKDMTVSERTGGTMVKIPKFWYKLTQDGNSIKVQIANSAVEGFNVSPAHMDRGDGTGERDVVYVGRYHCNTDDYKSTTGKKPKASITRSTARTSIHNLGTKIWQMDFATRFTIWLLYIVEFADWNSQAKIGYGCGNNSSTENMGYTDSMPYHTGTTQSSRTTYGLGTQYRNIEGLWDNVRDWCDGAYYDSNGMNIIKNPANFSDSTGGTSVGTPTSGYPSKLSVKDVSGTYQMFIPSESSGSNSTYTCDDWNFYSSSPCLFVGGSYGQNRNYGMFYVSNSGVSNASANIGCRLLELP